MFRRNVFSYILPDWCFFIEAIFVQSFDSLDNFSCFNVFIILARFQTIDRTFRIVYNGCMQIWSSQLPMRDFHQPMSSLFFRYLLS